ncbi:MAG TPA: HAD-IC family P-type ATPase, partial [Terracidiphilus sp.]|nr:HAD-IC family P-type ATPase [Terracidiphilus sp.]
MPAQETESLTLPVIGMTCAACQHHVESALKETAGVKSAHVDLMANRATVVFDPEEASPENLLEAIRSAGYDAVLPRIGSTPQASGSEENEALAKAVATLVGGAMAMLLGMPLGSEIGPADHFLMHALPWLYFQTTHDALRWTLFILTAVLVLWAGRGIYIAAAKALRHGGTNMNTLVSLGTGAAFLYSAYGTISPAPGRDLYFDAVLLILGFLLLGKALEARAKRHALAAVNALGRLRPSTARRIIDGVQTLVPLEEIRVGDQVLVLPGERFPVDARVIEGRTTVDESLLTGEATPLAREVGGRVLAGSLNYDGAVVCRAESLGEDTVLAQITRMVEQAQSSRAPTQRLADRASAIFVPIVLLLSVVTFAAWYFSAHSVSMALAATV